MIQSFVTACKMQRQHEDREAPFVKRIVCILMALLLAGWIISCKEVETGEESPDRLKVVTSIYVLYDFTLKIGGDHVSVTNLLPPGAEPHEWEPGTNDLLCLEQADVFIYNGAGMEHWLDKVVASLENKDLILVETTKGLPLRHLGDSEQTLQYDPHVWLNPLFAMHQMELISNALASADPEHQNEYNQAYQSYADDLIALDQAYRESLSTLSHRDLIVTHAAFGYLADAYGLNQISIEGISPDSEPDPARMAEIVDYAKEHDVQVIFYVEFSSPKVAETVAREIGARTAALHPLGGLTDEQLAAGEDYFSIMRKNLSTLVDALS